MGERIKVPNFEDALVAVRLGLLLKIRELANTKAPGGREEIAKLVQDEIKEYAGALATEAVNRHAKAVLNQ